MKGEPLEPTAVSPPRLPFVFSVGVTGHRKDALPAASGEALAERLRETIAALAARAEAVRKREAAFYSASPIRLIFVSPLADGADQLAAEIALSLGFELHAVLPFDRATYRRGLADDDARQRLDVLLGTARCVLELPGDPADSLDAYVMTGRATVAHSDVLLAAWDGLPPRGRGGTGEVVSLALLNGTPVVHVPVDATHPVRLMWSAFDPTVLTRDLDEATTRPFRRKQIDQMMAALFAPPADPQERGFLSTFCSERSRSIRARIEYPLMLAAAGVKRMRFGDVREAQATADIRSEWLGYRQACADRHAIDPGLDVLEEAYSWADRLATFFAQTYRSGHVFNFVLGGLAVCIGLLAGVLNMWVLGFALFEGAITAAIILNTSIGVRNEWHRRWLDYRQLAERLRPMRSLKLLGLAAPDPPGTVTNPVPKRWIDWYAAATWRAMGCPSGRLNKSKLRSLAGSIASHEIAPQVAYHERHARQIELLDERLGKIAGGLFLATLVASVAVVVGLVAGAAWVNDYNNWFTLVSAGFPALGTAVFGIRFQGDFGGSALRSQATADALRRIQLELAKGATLQRAADLTEQAGRTMLSDLDEWRLVNQQQELDLL